MTTLHGICEMKRMNESIAAFSATGSNTPPVSLPANAEHEPAHPEETRCLDCDGAGRTPNGSCTGDTAGGWADTCDTCNGTGKDTRACPSCHTYHPITKCPEIARVNAAMDKAESNALDIKSNLDQLESLIDRHGTVAELQARANMVPFLEDGYYAAHDLVAERDARIAELEKQLQRTRSKLATAHEIIGQFLSPMFDGPEYWDSICDSARKALA